MKYLDDRGKVIDVATVDDQIKDAATDPDKVLVEGQAVHSGELVRLNVGCGDHYAPGWTNIDVVQNGSVTPDIVASILDLPSSFDPGGASHIYLGHVLEHLDEEHVVHALSICLSLLQDGGQLLAVGPDADRAESLMAMGRLDATVFNEIATGGKRWPGDEHRWLCTEEKIVDMIRSAGFPTVLPLNVPTLTREVWPLVSNVEWQCGVLGVRGFRPNSKR